PPRTASTPRSFRPRSAACRPRSWSPPRRWSSTAARSRRTAAGPPRGAAATRLAPDSGGAGRWRGGLGMIVEFGVETDEDWLFTASFERARIPCQGLLGGGPGAPGRVETADGRTLDAKAQHWLRPGERVVLH